MLSWIAIHRLREREAAKHAGSHVSRSQSSAPSIPDGRKLSDDELLKKLAAVGIGLDRPSYAELAGYSISSQELCLRLITGEVRARFSSPFDADWVWIALTVLRERWFPEWPSFEKLDDLIQEGYGLLAGDPESACSVWRMAWFDFLRLFEAGSFRAIEEFDTSFGGSQCISNWAQDFEQEQLNAASKHPRWHRERIAFCQRWLELDASTDRLLTGNMRAAWAESLFRSGDPAGADALYKLWLEANPRWGWGWIRWADNYSFPRDASSSDLARAESLLIQALSVPGLDDRDDVLERLRSICADVGREEDAARYGAQIEQLRQESSPPSIPAFAPLGRPWSPPQPTPMVAGPRVGRNERCPCGSGLKFKKCCGP